MLIASALAAQGGSLSKYGPLSGLVASAGFLVAAVFALSLGWMKRAGSTWVPPEEAVPKATTRMASLITAVLLALVYIFLGAPDRKFILAAVDGLFLLLAVNGMLATGYLLKAYGFETTRKNWRGKLVKTIKLGGRTLTSEAQRIRLSRDTSIDRLVQEAQFDMPLVFEKSSLAAVYTKVTATFLILQSFGSLALGGAGLLLSVGVQ